MYLTQLMTANQCQTDINSRMILRSSVHQWRKIDLQKVGLLLTSSTHQNQVGSNSSLAKDLVLFLTPMLLFQLFLLWGVCNYISSSVCPLLC
jgi:hypothetical protein